MNKQNFLKKCWLRRLKPFGKVLLIFVTLPLTLQFSTDTVEFKLHNAGVLHLGHALHSPADGLVPQPRTPT